MSNIDESVSRFSGAEWFKISSETDVSIYGAGGVGSWLSLFLSRAVERVALYDFDIIETANMGGQFYSTDDIGLPKVKALDLDINHKYAIGRRIYPFEARITKDNVGRALQTDFVFSCVDCMETRALLFNEWLKKDNSLGLFVDSRLRAEYFEVFAIRKGDEAAIAEYKKTLFKPDGGDSQLCTYKATSYAGAMVAAVMQQIFNNYLTNIVAEIDKRVIPFHTEFSGPIMYFNTEEKCVKSLLED